MLEKLLVHAIAAGLTQATTSGAVDQNPAPDPDLTDAETRGRVAEVWELHRSYYHAVIKTLDNTDWPTPKIQLSGVLSSLTDAITPILAGQGPLGAVIGPVVSALVGRLLAPKPAGTTTPAGTATVPDPSQLK